MNAFADDCLKHFDLNGSCLLHIVVAEGSALLRMTGQLDGPPLNRCTFHSQFVYLLLIYVVIIPERNNTKAGEINSFEPVCYRVQRWRPVYRVAIINR